jgi:methionyl-tRNA formyltransferase
MAIVFVGAYAYAQRVLSAMPRCDYVVTEGPRGPRWESLVRPGAKFVEDIPDDPELVVVAGWRRLVPIKGPTVGFHSAKLPEYPGRAPVANAILRGDRTLTNTMLWLDDGVDTGDIIDTWTHIIAGKHPDRIYEDIGRSSAAMLRIHWRGLLDGTAPRRPQDLRERGPLTAKDGWARLEVPKWVEAFG